MPAHGDWYSDLLALADGYLDSPERVLDVGYSVAGPVHRLAQRNGFVYGLD